MPILQALSRKVSIEFKYSGRAQNCSLRQRPSRPDDVEHNWPANLNTSVSSS